MTRYMLRRLARAAVLRARGHDWIAVAKDVKSRPVVCRRWPEKYPEAWLMLYVAAQQMVFEAITREAVWTLTQMARSPDPRQRERAEKLLRRYGHRLRG